MSFFSGALSALPMANMIGLSTVANMGETVANNYYSRKNAKKAYERDVAYQQWQNEYNTPANQMQRLLDAGLNPNLLYQQISAGNSTGSVHSSMANEGVRNPLDKFLENVSAVMQLNRLEKQEDLLDNQVSEASARASIARMLEARYRHDNKIIDNFPGLSTAFILGNAGQNARTQVVSDISKYSAPVYDYFSKAFRTSPHSYKKRMNWLQEKNIDPNSKWGQWYLNNGY